MPGIVVRCGLLLLLSQFFAIASNAKSLIEYHLRVRQAITALDTLGQQDESESETDRASRINQTIAGVRSGTTRN